MIIGNTLLLAIVAAGVATLAWYIAGKLTWPAWLQMWIFGAVLLFIFATGPIVIGK